MIFWRFLLHPGIFIYIIMKSMQFCQWVQTSSHDTDFRSNFSIHKTPWLTGRFKYKKDLSCRHFWICYEFLWWVWKVIEMTLTIKIYCSWAVQNFIFPAHSSKLKRYLVNFVHEPISSIRTNHKNWYFLPYHP